MRARGEAIIAVCADTFDRVVPVGGKLGRKRHFRYHSTSRESERHRRIKWAILQAVERDVQLTAEPEWRGWGALGQEWRADVRVSDAYRHCVIEIQLSAETVESCRRRNADRLDNASIAEVLWLVDSSCVPDDSREVARGMSNPRGGWSREPRRFELVEQHGLDFVSLEGAVDEVGAFVCEFVRLPPR